jgi:hypothetical protein
MGKDGEKEQEKSTNKSRRVVISKGSNRVCVIKILMYSNGFAPSIARQRLDKQLAIRARNNRTNVIACY